MTVRRIIGRTIALLLLVPAGIICLAFPLYLLLFIPGGWDIIDDTRAALGGGTETTLVAQGVDCVRERSGGSGRRGGIIDYACVIDVAEPAAAQAAPAAGVKDTDAAFEEYKRQMDAWLKSIREGSRTSNRVERRLSTDRSDELPTVRLLSANGEQPRRLGLIWGDGEIVWRWLHWLMTTGLALGFGAASLYAAKVVWRRW